MFCSVSSVITFIDLAGHSKYMKTTLFGLAAHGADFAMLCIDGPSSVGKLNYILNHQKVSSYFPGSYFCSRYDA